MASEDFDFQQIHETYRPKITRYLAGLAGDNEAEDLCQEVFSKIHKGLPDYRAEARLSTWIYRIATNTYLDRVRSRSFKQQQKESLSPADEIDSFETDGQPIDNGKPIIEHQAIRSEMIQCIRGFINQLPEQYRVVLLLSEEEGFKNREIADILQISLANVKIRLHRAKALLKESLKNNCDFYLDDQSEIACDRKQDCD